MTPEIPVYATWNGTLWRLTYARPCEQCHRRHFHGGGDGPVPYIPVGGTWFSHCTAPDAPPMVGLILVSREASDATHAR